MYNFIKYWMNNNYETYRRIPMHTSLMYGKKISHKRIKLELQINSIL